MRTRRSPRNQERLHREIGEQLKRASDETNTPPSRPERRFCRACRSYFAKRGDRGECVLRGLIVVGWAEDRPCFEARQESSSA